MRALILISLVLSLAACDRLRDRYFPQPPAPTLEDLQPAVERDARPDLVVLETAAVIIVMDDGAQCIGPARERAGTGQGWTGKLTECAYPYSYQVQLNAGAVSGQLQLQEVSALGGVVDEDAPPFRPIAVVLMTDTIGRSYRFESIEGF